MANDQSAGFMEITINGETYDAVGAFTFNLGALKRKKLVGPDRVHGTQKTVQVPKVSGEIRDGSALKVKDQILDMEGATVVIYPANGKKYMFENADYTADGDIETEEAKIKFECEADTATEISA